VKSWHGLRTRQTRIKVKSKPCLGPECTRMMASRGPGHRLCPLCRGKKVFLGTGDCEPDVRETLSPWKPLFTGFPGRVYREGD